MPGGDRTGPQGMGPMTGRGAGYCAGFPVPGYMNPAGGRGLGMGWGRGYARGGRGLRRGYGWQAAAPMGYTASAFGAPYAQLLPPAYAYNAPVAPSAVPGQELEALKNQASYFENALEDIKKRIGELDAADSEKPEK